MKERLLITLISISFLLCNDTYGLDSFEGDYKISYIHRILQETQWPSDHKKIITLCVIGKEQNYPSFNKLLSPSFSRYYTPMNVVYGLTISQTESCNAIYVPYENRIRGKEILKSVYKKPIVTIGERDMGWHCAMFSFDRFRNHLRFVFNSMIYNVSQLTINADIFMQGYNIDAECS